MALIEHSVAGEPPFRNAPNLLSTFSLLLVSALAASTLKAYLPHEKAYVQFCSDYGVTHPVPLAETVICGFVTHYFTLGKPFSTVQLALTAIRHMIRLLGHDADLLKFKSSLQIDLLKRGYKRLCPAKKKREPRVPITAWVLAALAPHITAHEGVYLPYAASECSACSAAS